MTVKMKLIVVGILLIAAPASLIAAPSDADLDARVARILAKTPLIDGHNDLPWELRERFKGRLSAFDLKSDTSRLPVP